MTTIEPPLCMDCKHFVSEFDNWHCKAFPGGIPEKILRGAADHKKPIKGDHGIQFEPITKERR